MLERVSKDSWFLDKTSKFLVLSKLRIKKLQFSEGFCYISYSAYCALYIITDYRSDMPPKEAN